MNVPIASRIGRIVRDGWQVVGVTLLMLVCAELAYRGQAAIRNALGSQPQADRPAHPHEGQPWWDEWTSGGGEWEMRFDPYRGIWARPGRTNLVTIDDEGRRVTYDPAPATPKTVTLYMFGGSAMFGHVARDRYTIPSLVAEELARRGRPDVQVLNYAQSTYNLTQEVITLLLELRARRHPAMAVFMDGNNEVAPPFQNGRVGSMLNEERMASRAFGPQGGFAELLLSRLQLAQRLARFTQAVREPFVGDESLCPEVAEQYLALTGVAQALGREYAFETLFFWQPMLATTGKPLTNWERSLESPSGWRSTVAACTRAVDDLVRARGMPDYYPLHGLFDEDETSIFVDDYGHVVEDANRRIASAIVDRVIDRLPPQDTANADREGAEGE